MPKEKRCSESLQNIVPAIGVSHERHCLSSNGESNMQNYNNITISGIKVGPGCLGSTRRMEDNSGKALWKRQHCD